MDKLHNLEQIADEVRKALPDVPVYVDYHVILGEFEPITEHFGIRLERVGHDMMYVLYRSNQVRRRWEVAARADRKSAVKECEYLEKLNAPRWAKEEK